MNQVVITGMSCLTATGHDVESVWQALGLGQSGIDTLKQWDPEGSAYTKAGEIKDYNPRSMLPDRKLIKMISRHDVFGIYAASNALTHSQLIDYRDSLEDTATFNDRTAVYVGSPGNKFEQQYDFFPLIAKSHDSMQPFADELERTVHPMWLLRNLPNNVLAYTGIHNNFKGPNENITNHVVGGLQAVIEAYHAIASGQVDRAVVVAYDFGCDPQSYLYYGGLGLLSDDAIRPFDRNRDGTILAEGAGALILESKQCATERGATMFGEILSGATATEATGAFNISEKGSGLQSAIRQTLENSELQAAQVGMVTAHANGTRNSDSSETYAISDVFGAGEVPVTGFKWSFGHTLTAAGVIDTILTLKSLNEKTIPGIATLQQYDSRCPSISVSADQTQPTSNVGLVLSRGFAGLNVCLAIRSEVA